MIEGDIRREKIIEIMSNQKEPVSGSDLAKKFSVSRQVIVQDIALLRATNKNILSTNKGYFLYNPGKGPQIAVENGGIDELILMMTGGYR